jgi:hypothetical protein
MRWRSRSSFFLLLTPGVCSPIATEVLDVIEPKTLLPPASRTDLDGLEIRDVDLVSKSAASRRVFAFSISVPLEGCVSLVDKGVAFSVAVDHCGLVISVNPALSISAKRQVSGISYLKVARRIPGLWPAVREVVSAPSLDAEVEEVEEVGESVSLDN